MEKECLSADLTGTRMGHEITCSAAGHQRSTPNSIAVVYGVFAVELSPIASSGFWQAVRIILNIPNRPARTGTRPKRPGSGRGKPPRTNMIHLSSCISAMNYLLMHGAQ